MKRKTPTVLPQRALDPKISGVYKSVYNITSKNTSSRLYRHGQAHRLPGFGALHSLEGHLPSLLVSGVFGYWLTWHPTLFNNGQYLFTIILYPFIEPPRRGYQPVLVVGPLIPRQSGILTVRTRSSPLITPSKA